MFRQGIHHDHRHQGAIVQNRDGPAAQRLEIGRTPAFLGEQDGLVFRLEHDQGVPTEVFLGQTGNVWRADQEVETILLDALVHAFEINRRFKLDRGNPQAAFQ